ncbi:hypothetical protein [Streptomyces luteireticuli]
MAAVLPGTGTGPTIVVDRPSPLTMHRRAATVDCPAQANESLAAAP